MTSVDPFLIPVPQELRKNPEAAAFFDYLVRFLHDIWVRTGGGADTIEETSTGLVTTTATADEALATADTALQDVVDDLTPQLGGNLDLNGKSVTTPLRLVLNSLLGTPESGALEYDGDALYFTLAGVRRYVTLGNDVRVADSTVTDTTTETTIHTSAIAANELKAGRVYKVTLLGKTTTASAADFYTLRFKMGGTTLITVAMTAKNVTDEHFRAESYITIRTTGASGTYAAHVEGAIGDEAISVTPVTGSVDTTVSEDLVTTLQWDAADAGNIFTIQQALLEVIG